MNLPPDYWSHLSTVALGMGAGAVAALVFADVSPGYLAALLALALAAYAVLYAAFGTDDR